LSTIAERVALGAAFLDEHDPPWWREIDLETLDLGSGDRCVLGQRCPLEVLTAWLGSAPEDGEDHEFRYHAYAGMLTGFSRTERDALEDWAIARGFNRPFGDADSEYDDLTAEWARVIRERRAAAVTP
jgi:hypothetical protein